MGLSHSPSIVSSNLVLALDPANTKCYVGSGVTIRDLLGISSAGTLINGPTYSSAFGGYLNYDGANDYTSIPNSNPINLTDNVTFSMWCRMNDLTYGYYPLSKMTGLNGYEFGFDAATAKMFVGIRNNAGDGYKSAIASTTVYKNIWTHYTGTKSGVGVSIFINGEYSGGLALTYIGSLSNTNPFTLGSQNGSYYTPCDISQVLLYSKKLSDEEIKQNYDATKKRYEYDVPIVTDGLIFNLDAGNLLSYAGSGNSWVDVTKNNNIGLLVNGPTYSGAGASSYLNFDGTNDYISVSSSPSTFTYNRSSFTVGGWTNMTSLPVSYYGVILSKWNTGGGNDNEFILNTTDGNKFIFGVDFDDNLTPDAQGNDYVISNTTISANTWYYVVATFDNGLLKLYVNGIFESSIGASYTTVKTNTNSSLNIGRFGTTFYSIGRRGIVHLYNRALRSSEIYQNFNVMRSRYGI
jgi:hypothetical protein